MASSRAIEAARAFVRIGGEDGPLRKTLAGVTGLLKGTASAVGGITSRALSFAGGTLIAGGLAKATSAVFDFAESGAAIDDISKRTGASAEALSQLKYAAEQSGTSIEDVEKGGRKLGQVLYDANNGSKAAAASLAALGLSTKDLEGLSFEEKLMAVAEGLKGIEDDGARSAAAMDLLGKSGANLLPLMEDGAEGMRAMMTEADALGMTLSGDQAAAAAEFDDSWAKLKATLAGTGKIIGAALAPMLTYVFDIVSQGIPLIVTVAKAVGELLTNGALQAWAALKQLTAGIEPLFAYWKEYMGGLINSLKSGDVGLAAKIFWLTVKRNFLEGINAISNEWVLWKKGFLDVFSSALSAAAKVWRGWQKGIASGIVEVMAYVDSSIDAEAVKKTLDEDYERALDQIDRDAEKDQAARDAAFEASIGTVNQDLEAARAEWAAAIAQAKTQAEKVANEPAAATVAGGKFTDLIQSLKAGDIATRVESAVKQSGSSGDIRTLSGAGQLTSLINKTGEVSQRQLAALLQIVTNTKKLDQVNQMKVAEI